MQYYPKDDDTLLIKGCQNQHPLAQKYLYERYFGRLSSVAYRYASDKQECVNITNQAFLKIFQSIDKFQDGNLLAWMRTIVFRTALNHIRGQIIIENIDDKLLDSHAYSVHNVALIDLEAAYIINALKKLPDATRTVFTLFEIDGLSHQEIATILNISTGTSKWHVSEAKNKLRKILSKEYFENI